MTNSVRVVVGANAATDARQFMTAVDRLGAAARRLTASSSALAEASSWRGTAADRFRQDRQRLAAVLDRVLPAVERMAKGAQSVIDDIDREDATGAAAMPAASGVTTASAGSAGSGGSTMPARVTGPGSQVNDPLAHSHRPDPSGPSWTPFPPVFDWNGPGTPVVNGSGAFQPDHGHGDYGVEPPVAGVNPPYFSGTNPVQAAALVAYAESIRAASYLDPGPAASDFFQHYLDGSGSDLHYDSLRPYGESDHFRKLVNSTARAQIIDAQSAGQNSFDSGYIYNANMFAGNKNWTGAVGGCFYRVMGHRTPQGTWATTLQITSYYQFVPGKDFGPLGLASGDKLHELERMGIAQNYHSIGTGTVEYYNNGDPTPPYVPLDLSGHDHLHEPR